MNILKFAGVTHEGPAAHEVIDRKLDKILSAGIRAHERLRHNLRSDPRFAGVICRALGCNQGDCATVPKPLETKIALVPHVVEQIERAKKAEENPAGQSAKL